MKRWREELSGGLRLRWVTAPLFRWHRGARLVLSGGRWTMQLGSRVRRSLRWLVWDGILANASESILGAYQSIYLLALGATPGDIGLLGALANLAMPVAMMPGGKLAAKARTLRPAVIWSGLLSRVFLFLLLLLPWIAAPRSTLVTVAIVLVVGRAFLSNLLVPAWTTLISGIVPAQWRGRYFSTRNILMGAAGFLALLAVGQLIDRVAGLGGYQLALGVALLTGLGSVYAFSRIEAPSAVLATAPATLPLRQVLQGQGRFLAYCVVAAVWNLTVQISGPFFNVFLADEIRASASVIALASAASTLASLPGQRVFGVLSDRRGSAWVQRVTGFWVPLVPGLWGFISQPWQAFPLQLFSGFVWAGYNLAAFNLLLELTPDTLRPRLVAVYQALVGIGMAIGAALGGWIAQTWGYRPVFWISAVGRWVAAVVFALLVVGANPPSWWRRIALFRVRERFDDVATDETMPAATAAEDQA